MINNSSCPEIPLRIGSDQSVEFILLLWRVQGDGLHAHGVAVGPGLVLLELGATELPCDDISSPHVITGVGPEVVGCLSSAQGSATCNSLCLGLALNSLSYWLWSRLGLGPELLLRGLLEGRLLLLWLKLRL